MPVQSFLQGQLAGICRGGISVSSLGGQVKNPYDLTRNRAGLPAVQLLRSLRTLRTAGTGSDTGGSIRSPASADNLVDSGQPRGLISRDGIVAGLVYTGYDRTNHSQCRRHGKNIGRYVGYDPNDPVTGFGVAIFRNLHGVSTEWIEGSSPGVLRLYLGADRNTKK